MNTVKKKLLTDKYVLAGAVISLLLVGELSWDTFGEVLFGVRGKPNYTHAHCSACLFEFNYVAGMEGKTCPRCHGARSQLIPTLGQLARGGYTPGRLRWGRVVLFLVVTIVVVQGMVFLCLWRARVHRQHESEILNQRYRCQCPFCGRRLGYSSSKAGTGAICPNCKTAFLLPDADDPGMAEEEGAVEEAGPAPR